jgi:hypothetical protein
MADQDVNVVDALENAVNDTSETSTEETETKETTSTTDNGMIPRARYNEVSTKFQEAQKTWEAERAELSGKLEEFQKSVGNLSDVAKNAEEAQQIVSSLRAMSRDPKWSDLIDTLDQGLQDPNFDPTAAQATEETSNEETKETKPTVDYKSEIAKVKSEIEESFQAQKIDFLSQQAEVVGDAYMKELPEEYGEQDRKNIQELWSNRVDWDGIHQNPETLTSELSKSFQEVLKAYPVPGQSQTETTEETTTETEKQPTVEEQLQATIGKDWGALKEVDTPSGKAKQAVVSDDDFAEEFAKVFKLSNRG